MEPDTWLADDLEVMSLNSAATYRSMPAVDGAATCRPAPTQGRGQGQFYA